MNSVLLLFIVIPVVYNILESYLTRLLDKRRIRRDLDVKHCQFISFSRHFSIWNFKIFSSSQPREYRVRYEDSTGHICEGICRTVRVNGSYWIEGQIPFEHAEVDQEMVQDTLEYENQALRQKIRTGRTAHQQQKRSLERDIRELKAELKRLSL